MSNIKELIRAEIERRKKENMYVDPPMSIGKYYEDRALLFFLDTLEEPEQPTMGYDEAYLNEKIAKASKSWEGVDVDKFMDEIRGREPVSDDLEEEYKEYVDNDPVFSKLVNRNAGISIARHFAEWGAKHTPLPEDTVIFQKGVEEGKRLMMEGAVEGEVQEFYRDEDGIHCCVSVGTDYKPGTIVYVITIPKEDEQ